MVAAEDGSKLRVLFENVGYKVLAASFPAITDVPAADVSLDHPLRDPDRWPRVERNAQRAEAKRALPARFDELVKEFLDHYPDGLQSEACDAEERNYKVRGVEYARESLDPAELTKLLEAGGYDEVMKRTRRTLGKVNLAFPQELMKFADVPADVVPVVAERVVRLAAADVDSTPTALEHLAAALDPHGAAKWPVVSLIPFLLRPESAPFVKPTAVQRAADATGIDVEYDSMPNAHTYRLVVEMCEHVAELLADRGMPARDFIDVQTFLWFATGMARDMVEQRGDDADPS
ncbi:MAG: hypothetical protein KC731_09735 [Myxococcales bacterium]|nr:hypothetical protein [Myxococcales bacterium]